MNPPITLTLVLLLLGQAGPSSVERSDDSAARLEFMKKSLMTFKVQSIDNRKAVYRLQAEPAIRFTNPVSGSKDGAIFFWFGEDDRPAVAVQVYLKREGIWLQEFSLLTTSPLVATSAEGLDWNPSRGGVEFKSVPDAPRPALAAEPRLRQMHALAQEFVAEDFIWPKTWQPLRLLSKPLVRYGKPGTDVIDGAIFSFVLTTDPEVYLMVEARAGKGGPEWQYTFAPMTTRAVKCSRKGQEVWSLPRRTAESRNPTETFHVREFASEPSEDRTKSEGAKP
jgi:hypothetical protein